MLTYKLFFRHFHFQVRRTHAYPHKKALLISQDIVVAKCADGSCSFISLSCIGGTLSALHHSRLTSTWRAISRPNFKLEIIQRQPRNKLTPCPPSSHPWYWEGPRDCHAMGFTISDRVGFDEHIAKIWSDARQSPLFALRVLVAHGLHAWSTIGGDLTLALGVLK